MAPTCKEYKVSTRKRWQSCKINQIIDSKSSLIIHDPKSQNLQGCVEFARKFPLSYIGYPSSVSHEFSSHFIQMRFGLAYCFKNFLFCASELIAIVYIWNRVLWLMHDFYVRENDERKSSWPKHKVNSSALVASKPRAYKCVKSCMWGWNIDKLCFPLRNLPSICCQAFAWL